MKTDGMRFYKNTAEQALLQELVIPEATERKIEAAYDVVRAKSRERQQDQKIHSAGRRPFRKVWAAGLAAALLAVLGIGVAAATGYFSKTVTEQDGKVSYQFELNYELKPVDVKAVPEYLPEGMKEAGEGRYRTEDKPGYGITITPFTMVNIEEEREGMNFTNVDKVEKTVIQGMEAHIITCKEEQKYRRGKNIYLFNPKEGYVIWLFGDYNVSVEEITRVAENLKITVTENNALKYNNSMDSEQKEKEQAAEDAAWTAAVEKGVAADEIVRPGEPLFCEAPDCSFTIDQVKIHDSLFDVPGYTEQGVFEPERLTPWLNADGTHKAYRRVHYDGNGEILGEDEASVKFLEVRVTMEQLGDYVQAQTNTALDAALVFVEKRADGTWNFRRDYYHAVPEEEYELQTDHMSFYLDCPENTEGAARKDFFYKTLKKGDRLTYTLIFAVDVDEISGDNLNHVVLQFNAAGNDPTNPRWSALGTIE